MKKGYLSHQAYLSLGSNIDPTNNLPRSVKLLGGFGRLIAASTVWETRPIGVENQPNFLNACVLLETSLSAKQMQEQAIPWVETALKHVRGKNKAGPRSIDIDIMLFDNDILDIGRRHIPHPEIYERAFIAIALAEISPDKIHPETGERLDAIASRFSAEDWGMIKRLEIRLMTRTSPGAPKSDNPSEF